MSETVQMTRYERVQEILDRAAGSSATDYGGRGRFWHLPLPQLLEVVIHGVRMIAPKGEVKAAPCCSHGESAEAGAAGERQPRYPGRGAASGLVRGLRGQPPFDGAQFPRLPWGGAVVAEEEIAFISDWIDDGCPADDREIASFALSGTVSAPVLAEVATANLESVVARAFDVYAGSPNEYRHQYGELKQRVNLDCMSPPQIEKLREAFRELYRLNKWPEDRRSYNNIALIHQNHCQHGWERFLPWHRVYLYELEQTLQDLCPGVTMPYWDWTMPQYRPEKPEKGWIIPQSFKAFLTSASIAYLEAAVPKLPPDAGATLQRDIVDQGTLYTTPSELFAAVAKLIGPQYTVGDHRKRFIDALLAANALWYPLRYPAEYGGETINQAIHYHYPTADDIEQILSLRTFRDFGGGGFYNDSFGFLDQNPHNTMHIWTGGMNPDYKDAGANLMSELGGNRNRGVRVAGRRFHTRADMYEQPQFGDMFSNLTASYDPVFWPIHFNVDRLWAEWQQMNPQALPQDLDSVLTPWSYTIADTLDHRRFGYEYVKCSYLIPVGLATPVGRFVSQPIDVPETVRGAFRQAEVRLHRVPQLPRSCFIRVFLNLPDADAATPIDHEHYAGYLAIFGHGPCYGGPGHCDLPPSRPRQYDLRPRSHNTPRNHRVIVTKAARRLLAAGATSLQITLVVIGADYREDGELLRLEGVSLSFLD